jgi:predicted transcriptional regulator
MKTAISIPDDVFRDADHLAKRLKISRSELYSKAVADFLARNSGDDITESYNRAVAEVSEPADPAFQAAGRATLRNSAW